MKTELMHPFVEETIRVFQSMLDLEIRESSVEEKASPSGTYEVSATIGITGARVGAFVLSAPTETVLGLVSRMIKEPVTSFGADAADGLGELVNIVAGNGCRRLATLGLDGLCLALPAIVYGKHRVVWHSKDLPCLLMRFFDTAVGPFSVEVNLRLPD